MFSAGNDVSVPRIGLGRSGNRPSGRVGSGLGYCLIMYARVRQLFSKLPSHRLSWISSHYRHFRACCPNLAFISFSEQWLNVYGLDLNLNFAQPADLSALNNGCSKKFNNFPFTLTDSSRTDPILSEITRPGSDLHLCFPTQYYQLANHISWSYPSDCRKSRTMVWNRLTFFSKVGYKLLIKILIGQFNYNGLSPNFSLPYSPGNDDVVLVHTCGCADIFSP